MMEKENSAMLFANIIAKSLFNIPYASHKKIPRVANISIERDKSWVFLVFKLFINCGSPDNVVKIAAVNPSKVK